MIRFVSLQRAALALTFGLFALACGGDDDTPDAASDVGQDVATDAAEDASSDSAGDVSNDTPSDVQDELLAVPTAPSYRTPNQLVQLSGAMSVGAVRYQWDFGNGEAWDAPREESDAEVRYDAPGRYRPTLTVFDAEGASHTAQTLVSVTLEPNHPAREASSIVALRRGAAVVVPDDNTVVIVSREGESLEVMHRVPVPREPRSITLFRGLLAVVCREANAVTFIDPSSGSIATTVDLPRGALPFGAVASEDAVFVAMEGLGQVAEIGTAPEGLDAPALIAVHDAIPDVRGITLLPDGRLALSRFRSTSEEGLLAFLDPSTGALEQVPLRVDPQAGSDTEIGGVPTYLGQVLLNPNGAELALPGLQANIVEGTFRSDVPLRFETTIRAIAAFVSVDSAAERFEDRMQFDNQGYAIAGTYSSRGDFLFVVMPGSRTVLRVDTLTGSLSGSIVSVGHAPRGVALEDDQYLYVDVSLDRELALFDVSDFSRPLSSIDRVATVEAEPLTADVLRGKQLFNDSFDPRLSRDGYMACSHCHLDGEEDGRVWDFTDRGEGLRNTISLLGRAGGDGPIHWSGNFDEIQDFEGDIREAFKGLGLMDELDYREGTRSDSLGDPKAGISEDLDALAAYVASLGANYETPVPDDDASAARGRALFESDGVGCVTCHSGPRYTNSAFDAEGLPQLRDVGTLGPASGMRLGGPLEGIDTPSLLGVWRTAPYLHDGSAMTLRDVLTTHNTADLHGTTSHLSDAELDDLVRFLMSLGGS